MTTVSLLVDNNKDNTFSLSRNKSFYALIDNYFYNSP